MKIHNEDFTLESYSELIQLAKTKYQFISYSELHDTERFILWRHDCDFSLNRSLKLAQIEHDLGVKTTYFLNPHSEFYNIMERNQSDIIEHIIGLGHDIGLHFDSAYYAIQSEHDLDIFIESESSLLGDLFQKEIKVFSFHNPTSFILSCDAYRYGNLINCYSRWFKENVPYCSDSNGYWRHKRLKDALCEPENLCMQVLTHPGWWLDSIKQPRDRILRAANGRRDFVMRSYDECLKKFKRKNIT